MNRMMEERGSPLDVLPSKGDGGAAERSTRTADRTGGKAGANFKTISSWDVKGRVWAFDSCSYLKI